MRPHYGNEGLQSLAEELDRTAVISPEFKAVILGWAHEVARVAYKAGEDRAINGPEPGGFQPTKDRLMTELQETGRAISENVHVLTQAAVDLGLTDFRIVGGLSRRAWHLEAS